MTNLSTITKKPTMNETTNTLSNALFRIDPTQGLVQYTEAVKPYHTKIVEVLIEYVYKERVAATILEKHSWHIEFKRPDKDVVYTCGFGHVWSPHGANQLDTFPLANIIRSYGDDFAVTEEANSFLVAQSKDLGAIAPPKFEIAVTNPSSKQLGFVGVHTIISMNAAAKRWVVSGNISTLLAVDNTIYVNSDTGTGGNGQYTVQAVAVVGTDTHVTVKEPISQLAAGNGTLNTIDTFAQIPGWLTGTAVKLSGSGVFPSPLSSAATYYFVPTPKLGIFNLAKKRYPTEYEDFIPITTLGSGILYIERADPFIPGTTVRVDASNYSRNDGTYLIRDVTPEGDNFRVHVAQKIRQSTPIGALVDGYMRAVDYGYDEPVQCSVASAPDLYADTSISETLHFEFMLGLSDYVGAEAVENESRGGFGVDSFSADYTAPYGSVAENLITGVALTSGIPGGPTHTILPHGFDTGFYDIGGMEENLSFVSRNYGKRTPAE